MNAMKTWLIIGTFVLFTGLVLLGWESETPVVTSDSDPAPPGQPSFEVIVVKPILARPFAGLVPDGLFDLPPSELRFDHTNPGAEVRSVSPHRLALRADAWELVIETDDDGRPSPETYLRFSLALGNGHPTLRCRPIPPFPGHLRVSSRPAEPQPEGSRMGTDEELDGRFFVKLATCENVESGKTTGWPPSPLTVRGRFEGLPQR